jgi:hypothetical protein
MEKIKWKFDKKCQQWYTSNDSLNYFITKIITKYDHTYILSIDFIKTVGRFKKLSSAKKVAELLING